MFNNSKKLLRHFFQTSSRAAHTNKRSSRLSGASSSVPVTPAFSSGGVAAESSVDASGGGTTRGYFFSRSTGGPWAAEGGGPGSQAGSTGETEGRFLSCYFWHGAAGSVLFSSVPLSHRVVASYTHITRGMGLRVLTWPMSAREPTSVVPTRCSPHCVEFPNHHEQTLPLRRTASGLCEKQFIIKHIP